MTEILINTALFLLCAFAATYTPWVKGLAGIRASSAHQVSFGLLVLDLYVFSLNETIRESGTLYGVAFSFIPLAVGGFVFYSIRTSSR